MTPICLSLYNFYGDRIKTNGVAAKTVYGPVSKSTQLCAHAHYHVSLECCRKSFTTIVLGNHDFPLTTWQFHNI